MSLKQLPCVLHFSLSVGTATGNAGQTTLIERPPEADEPLSWRSISLCEQVRLMGSFDGWSKGVALSTREDGSDSVFRHFEGALQACKVGLHAPFLIEVRGHRTRL